MLEEKPEDRDSDRQETKISSCQKKKKSHSPSADVRCYRGSRKRRSRKWKRHTDSKTARGRRQRRHGASERKKDREQTESSGTLPQSSAHTLCVFFRLSLLVIRLWFHLLRMCVLTVKLMFIYHLRTDVWSRGLRPSLAKQRLLQWLGCLVLTGSKKNNIYIKTVSGINGQEIKYY